MINDLGLNRYEVTFVKLLKDFKDDDFELARKNIKMALMKGTEIVFQFLREYVRVHNQEVLAVSFRLALLVCFLDEYSTYTGRRDKHRKCNRRKLGGGDCITDVYAGSLGVG